MIKVNKLISALLISSLATSVHAVKLEVMPTVGKAFKASDDSLKDDEILYGVRGTVFLNNEVGVQAAFEASTDNAVGKAGAKTDIERTSLNVIYEKDTGKRIRPYALIGIGNESTHGTTAPSIGDGSQGFFNIGAGLKFGLNKRIDLITEARWIRKLSNNDDDIIATVGIGVNTGANKPKAPSIPSVNATSDVQNAINLAEFRKLAKQKVEQPAPVESIATVEAQTIIVDDGIPADAIILDEDASIVTDEAVSFVEEEVNEIDDSGYYVQMAALFKGKGEALTGRLEQKDYHYVLHNVDKGGKEATLVLVGPYTSRVEAGVAMKYLKRLKGDAFIYHMN